MLQMMNFELLNVSKTHSGRGIAAMLVEQSVALAQQQNLACLVALSTGGQGWAGVGRGGQGWAGAHLSNSVHNTCCLNSFRHELMICYA